LTPEEKEKLYQGIGYDENANIAMLPREVRIVFILSLQAVFVYKPYLEG
jgi:hypothetical protein